MKILGIDPSLSSTGMYYQGRSHALQPDPKLSRVQRLGWIHGKIDDILSKIQPDLAAVEMYAFSVRSRSVTVMAEVGGVVRALLACHGIPQVEIAPIMWKSQMMGRALIHAKKVSVSERRFYLSFVEKRYEKRFATTDEADAFMLAEFAGRVWRDEAGDEEAVRQLHGWLVKTFNRAPEGVLFEASQN